MGGVWSSGKRIGLVVLLWAVIVTHAAAAPPLQDTQVVHTVQAGETLSSIAQEYGVTVDAIAAINGLSDPDWLEIGQRLLIPTEGSGEPGTDSPGKQSFEYAVQPGDTLALIARRYGTTADGLARLNLLTNPNLIYVGQRLLILAAGDTSEQPVLGQVYVIQPDDTMARIASRFELSVWALAQANQIVNPNVIHVGQRLLIPTHESTSGLPLPFLELNIAPVVAVQGRTVQVFVETDGEVSLSGTYDERPLVFDGGAGHYRTLIGIPAMATPGPHSLIVEAVTGEQEITIPSMVQVVEGTFGVQYVVLSPEKAQLLDRELVTQEAERLWELTTQATLPGVWQGRFQRPLAGEPLVSTPFGTRRSYDGGPATSYHAGTDYSAPSGEPVYAPADGRVVLAEELKVRGNAVIIDHGRGVMTGYWHLSAINVTVEQEIEPGALLGWVGNTGLSTGPHLHWEIRVMGIPVDPLQWILEHIQ